MFKDDTSTFRFIPPSEVGMMNDPNLSKSMPPMRAPVNLAASPPPGVNRVRVQAGAGDRCVPPAKSKPKKRKNLENTDQSSISMECVEWSDAEYDVKTTVQQLGYRFPIIARVTRGHDQDSGSGLDLAYGQILQIHSYGEQDRIKAKTSHGSLISIPLCYPAEVKVLNQTQSTGTYSLMDALRSFPLPLKIQVQSVAEDVEMGAVNIYGMELTLICTYNELYIRANTIIEGWIDQSNICVVPASLDVRFTEATGMHGASPEEWNDYYNMFARSVRHLKFDVIDGIQGVTLLDRAGGYTSRPNTVIQPAYGLDVKEDNVYANIQTRSPDIRSHRKANIGQSFSSASKPKTENTEELYSNASFVPDSPTLPPKVQNIPPKRAVSLNLPKVLPDLTPKQKAAAIQEERREAQSKYESRSPDGVSHIHVNGGPHTNTYDNVRNTKPVVPLPAPKSPRSPLLSSGESADEQDVAEMFENVIKMATEQETRQSVRNMANRFDRSKQEAGRWNKPERQGAAPRAVVSPIVHQPPKEEQSYVNVFNVNVKTLEPNNNKKTSVMVHSPTNKYKTLVDVPKDLSMLTVSEVSQCLRLLKMDDHIARFERKGVNGKVLCSLRESAMVKDFGLNEFNASKLTRFIRGWRV